MFASDSLVAGAALAAFVVAVLAVVRAAPTPTFALAARPPAPPTASTGRAVVVALAEVVAAAADGAIVGSAAFAGRAP